MATGDRALNPRMTTDKPPIWATEFIQYPLETYRKDVRKWEVNCALKPHDRGHRLIANIQGAAKVFLDRWQNGLDVTDRDKRAKLMTSRKKLVEQGDVAHRRYKSRFTKRLSF